MDGSQVAWAIDDLNQALVFIARASRQVDEPGRLRGLEAEVRRTIGELRAQRDARRGKRFRYVA